MIRTIAAALILVLPLAACDGDKEGTTIAFNATGENGSVIAGVDGATGQVSIDAPGFSGKIKLPKIELDAGDFDLNGVKLFPGSTISGLNIDAQDGVTGKADTGNVRVTFDSPATPQKVQQWFLDKLNKDAAYKVEADGTGLSGKTDENKSFRLELTPVGTDHAKGTITVGG